MAIAFRAASTLIAGSGTSPTGTEPAGTVSGDVLLALFAVGSASATCGIPAGWTSLASGASSGPSFRYNFAYVVRGGSAPSLAFTQTGTVYRELYIVGFSGVDGTTPINAQADGGNTFSTTTVDPPAVTPTVADAMITAIFVAWAGSGGGGFTPPANYTLRTNNAAGNDGGIITRLLSGGSGASEDPGAVTGAGTVGDVHTFTLALTPSVGGGGGATVTAVPAQAAGDLPAPSVAGGANVTAPPATGTGDIPGTFPVSSEVAAVPADAIGSMPAPSVTATGDAIVTAVPADATGDLVAPTVAAGASVTGVPADATGDLATPVASAGATVGAAPADGTGDLPAPTLVGTIPTPEPDTPTSLTLDAHVADLELDAHGTALSLDAHRGTVELDAHSTALTLDAHALALSLDA